MALATSTAQTPTSGSAVPFVAPACSAIVMLSWGSMRSAPRTWKASMPFSVSDSFSVTELNTSPLIS